MCLLLVMLVSGTALGQTRYVSDQLEVTLRTGPSTRNTIVRILTSGAQVEVLESDAASGYSRVQVGQAEGWVLTRFLDDQPVARDRLQVAQRQLTAAREELAALKEQLASTQGTLSETQAKLDDAQGANTDMSAELTDIRSASANAIQLRDQNKSLRQRVIDMEREMNRVAMENRELASRANREWFVIGAAVLIVGILLGIIVPRLKPRRRSSWGDF
jgi:SH3 domain protein